MRASCPAPPVDGGGRLFLSLGLLAWAVISTAARAEEHSPPTLTPVGSFVVDASVWHLSGEYGTGSATSLDGVVPRLRWLLPRGEVRVSIPFLRTSGATDVVIVGGAPAAPPRDGPPVDLPGRVSDNVGTALTPSEELVERSASGLGDMAIQGEWFFVTGTASRPWLSGLLRVKVPTGDEEAGLGTGETDVEAGVDLVQPLGRTSLLAGAGYTRVGDPPGFDYDDIRRLGAGLSYAVGAAHHGYVYGYLEDRTHPVPGLASRLDLSLGGGLRLGRDGRTRLSGTVLLGLSDTAEDFGFSIMVGGTL